VNNNTKIEGTVNLSISELDNLRNQITTLTVERDDLKKHAKEVQITIVYDESSMSYRSVNDYNSYRESVETYCGRRCPGGIPQKMEGYKTYANIDKKISYIGLDDVRKEIQKEEEEKVIEKLGNLERQILELKKKEQELRTKQSETIISLNKLHEDSLFQIHKDYNKTINLQDKRILELEGKEVDYTKDEIISKLKQEIEQLKLKQSFWSFLH